jgi:hypothetical protein
MMSAPAHPSDGGQPPLITIAEPVEETARLLRSLQNALVVHPFATRAAIRVLVAEGRAFAATEEGRRWRERLDRSESMRTARTFWEGLVYPLVAEGLPTTRPTTMLDDFFAAIGSGGAEAALARAFTGR